MPKAQRLKPPRDRDPDAFVEPWSVKWLQRSLCLMAEESLIGALVRSTGTGLQRSLCLMAEERPN